MGIFELPVEFHPSPFYDYMWFLIWLKVTYFYCFSLFKIFQSFKFFSLFKGE